MTYHSKQDCGNSAGGENENPRNEAEGHEPSSAPRNKPVGYEHSSVPRNKAAQGKEPAARNKRKTGAYYEAVAARFLELQGYRVIERNFRCRTGEIDIIALDKTDHALCFVEVKYRSSIKYGYPGEAVGAAKQRSIIGVSQYYMLTHRRDFRPDIRVRYDVVEILGDKIRILKNAFGAGY